jgi:S-(hydroxymethyl)glutathione synthase
MKTVRTEIVIDAAPQTIWSILDDLELYSEWNKVLPQISGQTTYGAKIDAVIEFTGAQPQPFQPTLTRIVGARELRWVSEVPSEPVSRAEHYFILTPLADGRTHLEHCESFDGPLTDMMWSMVGAVAPIDYDAMNHALKARAETAERQKVALHPVVDQGASDAGAGSQERLRCQCNHDPVELVLSAPLQHTHLCGCSLCWKPEGASFALIALVPDDAAKIVAGQEKLQIVASKNTIQRHACRFCGVHMVGRVENTDHHFFGLAFVHPELSRGRTGTPEFAGFVSSIIESGTSPTQMRAVRKSLNALGIPAYDSFSPELMDLIAWHKVKLKKTVEA